MRGLLAALLLLLALPAWATQDGWPALYDVTGVAGNDVLNIRAVPSAGSEIIGFFRPDARDIEVIGPNDAQSWGQVNFEGQSGWVSLRFMARQPGQWAGDIPQIRQCFGTEPFWTLAARPGTSGTWSTPEGQQQVTLGTGTTSRNRIDRAAFKGRIGGADFVLTTRIAKCSDGMSDRLFGISADLLLLGSDETLYSGCCSIAP